MAKHPFSPSRTPLAEQPKFENVLITPEAATAVLAKAHPNFRALSQGRVMAYSGDMAAGAWRVTGDTIKFNTAGELIDGQHRLRAIAVSKQPIETTVALNVPDDAFHAMDIGGPRSTAQLLSFLGVKRANMVSAVLRWLLEYNRQLDGNRKLSVMGSGRYITTAACEAALEAHPGIITSVEAARGWRDARNVPESIGAFVHYMGSRTSPEKADEFVALVAAGAGFEVGSPVHTLLSRVRDHRATRRTPDRIVCYWLTATAWLAFEAGVTKLRSLAFRPDSPFPVFRCDEVDAKAKAA